uniref:DUF1653 domain-containing protein n=1 Tax=Craspedostauros australis TaxID=1486917 RepID=A0A7R9WNV2_9STRA|mmetsp:Transcript_11996/g.33006  ORF Transcript_11996/g.33006 Transcript_11996/m.33006 type:complete len:139 (+) Transcript_11996:162-578(+)
MLLSQLARQHRRSLRHSRLLFPHNTTAAAATTTRRTMTSNDAIVNSAIAEASVLPGRYKHYKGNEYEVFFVATHSETSEKLVVYRCLYGDYSHWVRPLEMFTETVTVNDEVLPRFKFVGAMAEDQAGKTGTQKERTIA